jgi:hypothetical protein
MKRNTARWLLAAGVLCGCSSSSSAQMSASDIIKRGFAGVAASLRPMLAEEQDEVLTVVAEMLGKKISFHPDGHSSSIHYHQGGGATRVEWKDFKVVSITPQAVTTADRANGITRRYLVGFGCVASRTWGSRDSNWSEWRNGGYLLFPSAIRVEEMSGKLVANLGEHGQFMRGGGAIQPASSGGGGLPPGMKRAGQ